MKNLNGVAIVLLFAMSKTTFLIETLLYDARKIIFQHTVISSAVILPQFIIFLASPLTPLHRTILRCQIVHII